MSLLSATKEKRRPVAARLARRFCGLVTFLMLLQACGSKKAADSPDQQIREGWSRYRLGEFNSAVRIFRSVQESQPRGSEFRLQALYGEASCWNHRRDGRDIAKAVAGYQAVIQEAPQDPLAAWCALDIVRTRHLAPADKTIDYQGLVQDYATVYRTYPETPAGEEAFLYECNLSLAASDRENPQKLLEKITAFLSAHPKSPYRSQFYSVMSESYRRMDDQARRIDYMIKSLESREVDPANPIDDRSTAYWNIAYAAEFEAGNFAIAREYYRRLMSEYPQDIRIFDVRKALERMDALEETLREGREPAADPNARTL